jgi:hypothetical protein
MIIPSSHSRRAGVAADSEKAPQVLEKARSRLEMRGRGSLRSYVLSQESCLRVSGCAGTPAGA